MAAVSEKAFSVVAVRFFALLLIFKFIEMAVTLGGVLISPMEPPSKLPLAVSVACRVGFYGVAGFFLLLRAEQAVIWILRKSSSRTEASDGNNTLLILGYSVAGIYFIITGLENLISIGTWQASALIYDTLSQDLDILNLSSGIFKTAAGCYLLVDSDSLVRLTCAIRSRMLKKISEMRTISIRKDND